ncbi:AAA family ATPase [Helicobacter brantae]|uniref:AAA family ATPase n=1 Tax=Helicobacter brantae TaxID=375927 RepID=A0A3D8IZ03_9HELI|nr:AAA family ATPase [Helicobacter brantae]RDU70283.1 AAA family ATPase [Helicobacter brantae]
MRRHHRRVESFLCETEVQDRLKFWILKILLELDGLRRFCDIDGYISNHTILHFLDLEGVESSGRGVNPQELLRALREKYQKMQDLKIGGNKALEDNLAKLKSFFHLSKNEVKILEFLLCLKQYKILDEAMDLLPREQNLPNLITNFSRLLEISRSEVETIFSPRSTLCKTAIIEIDRYGEIEISDKRFVFKMFGKISKIEELFEAIIKPCSKSELTLKDYNHIQEDVSNIYNYLKNALSKKIEGVNILLYGKAGTGKTELVKTLAQTLKASLYEVSYTDEDGDFIEGRSRMGAYRIAQNLLRGKKLLMYDEAEDIFYGDERFLQKGKAWINRSLECNKIPTFWITNKISKIDEAIIRRFDYILELPIPPKSKRKELLQKYCSKLIDRNIIEDISFNEKISPALVQRASRLVEISNTKNSSKLFAKYIDNSLQAMGYKREKISSNLPQSYDLRFINADIDANSILKGLHQNPNARICLYGVAGSGKSAYGRYLAQSLNLPCILKKGSDLLDKYVGGTEQNIAQAFEEAKANNAVLIFDEVDSFLQDRSGAVRNWEITQVNEMLVQMESFDGIFIATTNLINNLDKASLRRFDLKAEFKYLKSSQVWGLFSKECEILGLKVDKSLKEKVEALSNISAGDFATITRQARFSPIIDGLDFYQRLLKKAKIKNQEESKTIGFASNF